MKMQANEARYLPLLIGGVAVILLGSSGIVAVMAWTPASTDVAGAVLALDEKSPMPPARPVSAQAQIPPAQAEGDARVRVKCPECGVVASTREIEQLGAAGGATRSGQNEISGRSTKSYEITVRMNDGSSRMFMDANPANWRPGERVILIEGASQSSD